MNIALHAKLCKKIGFVVSQVKKAVRAAVSEPGSLRAECTCLIGLLYGSCALLSVGVIVTVPHVSLRPCELRHCASSSTRTRFDTDEKRTQLMCMQPSVKLSLGRLGAVESRLDRSRV
jgi:hypothetical protein